MTTEIAILNQTAVALAADSAVTIGGTDAPKIYPSANKLFMLSKYHPVGIMIYSNAYFMGVYWETIIKIYREELGTKHFDHLAEYGNDFLRFIETNRDIFPESQQYTYNLTAIGTLYSKILNDSMKRYFSDSEGIQNTNEQEPQEILDRIIDNTLSTFKNLSIMKLRSGKSLPHKDRERIERILQKDIENIKNKIFTGLPLSPSGSKKLTDIATLSLTRYYSGSPNTGIVISGYGEKDIFPALVSYTLESIIGNKLKYQKATSASIDFDQRAAIRPFAQSDMIRTFIEGIAPDFENALREELVSFYRQISDTVANTTPAQNTAPNEGDDLNRKVKKIYTFIDSQIKHIKHKVFINPLMDIVVSLPKLELAAMAETLVNLTSFKGKLSEGAETVGGPVDVALISKGDGFIWIRRKHYFDKEYNTHFLNNYFRKGVL